tara:strand:- start:1160 stop:2017 length:858 start_codon:yes stop_codon:yes gene_type:complete
MKILFRLSSYLILILSFQACDIIEDPVVPFSEGYRDDLYGAAPIFGLPQTEGKNVLIEDFTANQCGNCPPAAEIAESLMEANPDRVFPIGIHVGSLAVPSGEYEADWRCAEGEELYAQIGFLAYPLGRINRFGGNANFLGSKEWGAKVLEELNTATPLELQVHTSWFANAGHLNIHVNGQFVDGCLGTMNLSVLLLESGLIGDQLYYGNDPEHIEEYEFNHLLRGSVSGSNGLPVLTDAVAGDSFQSDFTINWEEEWVIENSSLIAIVSDENGYVINCLGIHLPE